MQKISSYLYPNRIELLADVAGFTTEYTNVYQRTVKIYNGVDNVLEFDIKNADQKRIDLTTLSSLSLNVMDSRGTALSNSPYTVTATATKGIAKVIIPEDDLSELSPQFLKYSVTARDTTGNNIILYADSRFGAVGTIQLIGDATPTFRDDAVYKTFVGEIDLNGNVMHRSSAISAKFYEAEVTTVLNFELALTGGFIGTVYLEGTKDMTISVNSFLTATQIQSHTFGTAYTGSYTFYNVPVDDYNFFRITWKWPDGQYLSYYTDNGPGKVASVTVF
jgi:hypothetical protein